MPWLTSELVQQSKTWQAPDAVARASRLLRWAVAFADIQPNELDIVLIPVPVLMGATYSKDLRDTSILFEMLSDLGFLRKVKIRYPHETGGTTWHITPKGRLEAQRLQGGVTSSEYVFVAMWFADDILDAWHKGINPAIRDNGFTPIRVDQLNYITRVDDEIIKQVEVSNFVVADFTGHRGGVYFEAGYAMGIGRQIFWTCRADQVGELHFDIRQYNCIAWHKPADLRARLRDRIRSVIGLGPRPLSAR